MNDQSSFEVFACYLENGAQYYNDLLTLSKCNVMTNYPFWNCITNAIKVCKEELKAQESGTLIQDLQKNYDKS